MQSNTVYDCTIVHLDKHHHAKGNITVVENGITVPFDVRRAYYLYDVPGGESRGGHAHKELSQLIVAASGSFDVTLDDGNIKRTFTLNRPYQGLYIVPGIWRELNNFSSGSVCLVLASHPYDEHDYIRNYEEYIQLKKCLKLKNTLLLTVPPGTSSSRPRRTELFCSKEPIWTIIPIGLPTFRF